MPRKLHRGERCGVDGCKAQRYYVSDGLTYCINNHLAAGIFEYQIDDDEVLAAGLGARRKRLRQDNGIRDQEEGRIAYGKAGYAVFLQAMQLIMRHQASFIGKELGIPQFSELLKSMWCMFLEAQDSEDKLPECDTTDTPNEENTKQDISSPAVGNSELSDRESILFSDDAAESDTSLPKQYISAKYQMSSPILLHTVALSYLTLMLLRAPISIHDFREWITSEKFPYIRAIRYIPVDLRARLMPGYYEALDPQSRPRLSRLWKWTQQTANFLTVRTGTTFPVLNYRPILFSMVKDFLLPLDVYNATVAALAESPIDLSIRISRTIPMNSLPPELRVLCLALVVGKIFYNLDGIPRTASSSDPAARGADPKTWQRTIQVLTSELQGVDLHSKVEPADALTMTEQAVDQYLQWFSKTWINDMPTFSKSSIRTPQVILDMFPLPEVAIDPADAPADINITKDKLKTIEWLYSQPVKAPPKSRLSPGREVELTAAERPGKGTPFDDLIDHVAVKYGVPESDLRKNIIWLERYLSRR